MEMAIDFDEALKNNRVLSDYLESLRKNTQVLLLLLPVYPGR